MNLKELFGVLIILVVGTSCNSFQNSHGVNIPNQQETYRPVVIWHGMGDTCCYPFSMGRIADLITAALPGIYVYSVEIGNNMEEDQLAGFFMNVNEQVAEVCSKLKQNVNLTNGFNAVGFSQGSQFLRAYVERCNDPPVYNLVSVGGQHQGVYGFPKCPGDNYTICEIVRELLDLGAYDEYVQSFLVQAEYWQDPFNLDEYISDCIFLPDINNQGPTKNETYKANLVSLNKFAMVRFTEDTMVQPIQSEWFEFYAPGQDVEIIPLQQSQIYTEDWIGLQKLDASGRLDFYSVVGDHLQFTDQWFNETVIYGYFNNFIESK